MGQNQFTYFDEEKHLSFLLRLLTTPSWQSNLQLGQYTNHKTVHSHVLYLYVSRD